jgi:hypothetical protein
MSETKTKQKRAFFLVRAAIAFVLLIAVIAGLYIWGYRSWLPVAEWADEEGGHNALMYDGETYALVGKLGKGDLTAKNYPIDKVLGQVKDDGSTMATETETFPAETEEGETLKVIPPDGDPTLPAEHTYVLYSVEKKEDYLLVLEQDGEYYLYKLVAEDTTADTEAQ